jgi:elongation factor Ts
LDYLRQRGAQIAETRQGRAAAGGQGRVGSYVHHDGRLGAVVEVNCETDFVARTADFTRFCEDVALHIAAMSPRYIRTEDVPAGEAGGLCLLEQPFVKDPQTTVGDLLKLLVAKTGEQVVIRRFVRFAVGEEPATAATP